MRNYLPGLNGIRAIAATVVILAHTTLALDTFGLKNNVFGYLENGELRSLDFAGFGVSIFFVLSGFLITYLLLKEKENLGINLKKFYVRRVLRIWPLYYVYLAIVLVTLYFFDLNYDFSNISFYVFLSANIAFALNQTIPYLIHYWSLGVEEQFYLFWPLICRLKNKVLLKIAIYLIVLFIGSKTVLHIWFPNTLLEKIIHISRFHCMLMGGVGAILYFNNNQLFIKLANLNFIQLIGWLIYLLAMFNQFHIVSFLDNEIISFFTVFIILGQITSSSFINLERKWLNFVGKISFGLYVYHPLLIFFLSKVVTFEYNIWYNYLIIYGVVLSTTIVISWVSYTYLESYFLKIKDLRYSNR
ncbi:acyltransferase [bacterium]|nr:acyltransferase [bacterium]